jgi:hypothetical protein
MVRRFTSSLANAIFQMEQAVSDGDRNHGNDVFD